MENYDYVNHPPHYTDGGLEVIEMMERIWGAEAVINFCQLNAFKYRMRLGKKPDQSPLRDLSKADWYERKVNELKTKHKL